VWPVAAILEVTFTGERFNRPEGFLAEAFWADWTTRQRGLARRYRVTLHASPAAVDGLARRERPTAASLPAASGRTDWTTMDISFASLEEARDYLLPFGGSIEILTPEALRRSVVDYAQQVVQRHGTTAQQGNSA
jgi:predicted DNA-binding transcriptional regulator YafY